MLVLTKNYNDFQESVHGSISFTQGKKDAGYPDAHPTQLQGNSLKWLPSQPYIGKRVS